MAIAAQHRRVSQPSTREGARKKKHKKHEGRSVSADDAMRPGALLQKLLAEPVRFIGSPRDQLKASMGLDEARAAHYEIVNEPASRAGAPEPAHAVAGGAPAVADMAAASPSEPALLYAPRIATRFTRPQLQASGLHNRGRCPACVRADAQATRAT